VLVGEIGAPQAMIDIAAAEPARELCEQVVFLERRAGRREEAGRFGSRRPQRLGGAQQRILPRRLAPLAIPSAHQRALEALLVVQAVAAVAIAVRGPGLIDLLADPRHVAHDFAAQRVGVHLRAGAIVRRDRLVLRHFPGPCTVPVRLVVQRANRAEIDDVA
jgi:hypothetical protein